MSENTPGSGQHAAAQEFYYSFLYLMYLQSAVSNPLEYSSDPKMWQLPVTIVVISSGIA